jgi:hypothetical protein
MKAIQCSRVALFALAAMATACGDSQRDSGLTHLQESNKNRISGTNATVLEKNNFCGWVWKMQRNLWFIRTTEQHTIQYDKDESLEFVTKGRVNLESPAVFKGFWKKAQPEIPSSEKGYSCACFDLTLTIPQEGEYRLAKFVTEIRKVEPKKLDTCRALFPRKLEPFIQPVESF